MHKLGRILPIAAFVAGAAHAAEPVVLHHQPPVTQPIADGEATYRILADPEGLVLLRGQGIWRYDWESGEVERSTLNLGPAGSPYQPYGLETTHFSYIQTAERGHLLWHWYYKSAGIGYEHWDLYSLPFGETVPQLIHEQDPIAVVCCYGGEGYLRPQLPMQMVKNRAYWRRVWGTNQLSTTDGRVGPLQLLKPPQDYLQDGDRYHAVFDYDNDFLMASDDALLFHREVRPNTPSDEGLWTELLALDPETGNPFEALALPTVDSYIWEGTRWPEEIYAGRTEWVDPDIVTTHYRYARALALWVEIDEFPPLSAEPALPPLWSSTTDGFEHVNAWMEYEGVLYLAASPGEGMPESLFTANPATGEVALLHGLDQQETHFTVNGAFAEASRVTFWLDPSLQGEYCDGHPPELCWGMAVETDGVEGGLRPPPPPDATPTPTPAPTPVPPPPLPDPYDTARQITVGGQEYAFYYQNGVTSKGFKFASWDPQTGVGTDLFEFGRYLYVQEVFLSPDENTLYFTARETSPFLGNDYYALYSWQPGDAEPTQLYYSGHFISTRLVVSFHRGDYYYFGINWYNPAPWLPVNQIWRMHRATGELQFLWGPQQEEPGLHQAFFWNHHFIINYEDAEGRQRMVYMEAGSEVPLLEEETVLLEPRSLLLAPNGYLWAVRYWRDAEQEEVSQILVSPNLATPLRPIAMPPGKEGISVAPDLRFAGTKLYMLWNDGEHGEQVWCADAETLTAERLTGFAAEEGRPEILHVEEEEEAILFTQDSQRYGRELWISWGTRAGTFLIEDAWPGGNSGLETGFYPVHDHLVWATRNGEGLSIKSLDRNQLPRVPDNRWVLW